MNEVQAAAEVIPVIGMSHWFRAAVLIVAGYLLAKLVAKLADKMTTSHFSDHHRLLLVRVLFYFILSLFLISALREMGFKLSVLLGAAGILTVAIGFASQTSASNLISGLFLLGEKPFQVGDVIDVGGIRGTVLSIDLLSIKLRTFDNLYIRIPNETLIKTTITNVSKFPIRRLDLTIGVAYREDIKRVREVILKAADGNTLCLEDPKPKCIVDMFADSAINLRLMVWTKKDSFLDLKDSILEDVKSAFDKENIEIPFPHLSLYAGSKSDPIQVELAKRE